MSLFTSTKFASCSATGTDWRDTSKKVLESLFEIQTKNSAFNLGFLYISDHLAADAPSILNLFRSVLNVEHWTGCVGLGVCSNGEAFIDEPAISVMIGQFDEGSFCIFSHDDEADGDDNNSGIDNTQSHDLESWLSTHDPMLVVSHGIPDPEEDLETALQNIERETHGFLVGGLTSSRHDHVHFADDAFYHGFSGVAFAHDTPVATTLSQGCSPIGAMHTITKADGHIVHELNAQSAVEVFENDLRVMAIKKLDRDPDTILIDEDAVEDNDIPEEFHSLFQGDVQVALPVSGTDQNDYLVRHILGLDKEGGSLSISGDVIHGDRMMFVYRDHQTVQQDLSISLLTLRERVIKDTGCFEPKGAIYVSCVARAFSEGENDGGQEEMALIREIIGEIPLTGFYAGGEISNARLYGYTGILTLFL